MNKSRLLIVDDEKNIREGLKSFFISENFLVEVAENGKEAIKILKEYEIDFIISDLRMDEMSGEELVDYVRSKYPKIPILIITAHGDINSAVEIMKKGAVDFITKPINLDQILIIVKRNIENYNLVKKHKLLEKELETLKKGPTNMIGKSKQIKTILDTIKTIAPTKANVLITGESGVGKEIVANAIQSLSDRADKPFIKVNCAALNEGLLESELFGHEQGAYTDAKGQKKGRFELADKGTIFLDEIGEMSLQTQVKLLRVLQEKKFERVGGEKSISVDIRIIVATNKNLQEEIKKGNFREDLYYRLNVVQIDVPPLRERKDDILLLSLYFLNKYSKENNKTINGFDKKSISILTSYNWPGNVRELENVIQTAVIFAKKEQIEKENLPKELFSSIKDENQIIIPIGTSLDEAEKIVIKSTLAMVNNNKVKTSEILNIGRATLDRKLKEMK